MIASYHTLAGSGVLEPSRYSFEDRVAAAAAAGFDGLGIITDDYKACRARGLSDTDMRVMLDDHGLRLAEIEFLYDWATTSDGEVEATAFAIADAFGSRHVNVGDLRSAKSIDPIDRLAESFAALCDRAAEHGLIVALEFLPWTGIPDAATAADIVRLADRDNGGVLVDSWHYFRGPAEEDSLRAIDPGLVTVVQLSDADAEIVGELVEDSTRNRRLPGEGTFDLVGLLRVLRQMGVEAAVSVEVISDEHRALPLVDAARQAHDSAAAVLARV